MNQILRRRLSSTSIKCTVNRPSHQVFYSTASHNLWNDAKESKFVGAAKTIASIPKSEGLPEIIVTGRANAGKSTLLNHVLGRRDLVSTSKKAGHTKSLNFFRVGSEPGKLILVDAPGYGARGRPEWGELFDHYIQNREQLRRIYILFNAKHGLNQFDAQMLAHLSGSLLTARGTQPFTLQSIITKADLVPVKDMKTVIETMRKDIWKAAPLCLPPIVTSSEMSPPFGLDLLRKDIAKMCGLQ